MLTDIQRAELEQMGAANVRLHLSQYGGGRNSAVGGFRCGDITRGYIYDWLAEIHEADDARQASTLLWAKIAGWASIISVIVTAVGIWLQK